MRRPLEKSKKNKKVGDWLVDIALEGSGDYQVTERKRGFDDSISKLQHVHCIIHHIPHLRKRQGEGSGAEILRVKKQESLEMRKQNEVLRNVLTGINFILLSKHLTLKHANNKREWRWYYTKAIWTSIIIVSCKMLVSLCGFLLINLHSQFKWNHNLIIWQFVNSETTH